MRKLTAMILVLLLVMTWLPSVLAADIEEDPDHTTEAVDHHTELADGSYTPAQFTFSGGTGKVKITCPEITVENGLAYAHLVFSSTSYTYVKASGIICYAEAIDGKAHFVIPCALEHNNRILGLTTKMSTPHEVEYMLLISMEEPQETDAAQLSAEAPRLYGYDFESNRTPECADNLRIFAYSDGLYVIEVDIGIEILTEDMDDDSLKLYRGPILRYLAAPEDAEVPAGCEQEYIIIRTPVTGICDAADASGHLTDMGYESLIRAYCAAEEDGREAGYAGTAEEMNYKALILNKVKLVIANAENLQVLIENAGERLNALNIPVLAHCSDNIDAVYALLFAPEA